MYISELQLKNFRNYSELTMHFSPQMNVLYGDNGSGKTNVIEAISILSNIKSFRNTIDSEIIKWKENYYYCSSIVLDHYLNHFEIGCSHINNQLVKKCKIDNHEILSSRDYYGKLLTVIFSPNDIDLINGEPEIRRKFFDSVISKTNPIYFSLLSEYKKVISNRNKLLKTIRDNHNSKSIDELSVWDEIYIEKAVLITKERVSFAIEFESYFNNVFSKLSKAITAPVLSYYPSITHCKYDHLRTLIKSRRTFDLKNGTTSIGPHRDNYVLEDGNKRKFINFASQGQRRLAAISFKIVELFVIEKITESKCILLIDDIYPELDFCTRTRLLEFLQSGNQIFFTMANKDLIFKANKIFFINNNSVKQEK